MLLASASKQMVCVYSVVFEQNLLILMCSGAPPSQSVANAIVTCKCTADGALISPQPTIVPRRLLTTARAVVPLASVHSAFSLKWL